MYVQPVLYISAFWALLSFASHIHNIITAWASSCFPNRSPLIVLQSWTKFLEVNKRRAKIWSLLECNNQSWPFPLTLVTPPFPFRVGDDDETDLSRAHTHTPADSHMIIPDWEGGSRSTLSRELCPHRTETELNWKPQWAGEVRRGEAIERNEPCQAEILTICMPLSCQ